MKENNLEQLKIHEQMLVEQNKELKARNEFLERCVEALKLNNSKITAERNNAIDELNRIKSMSMFEFGNTYCSDDSLAADGKAFARSLLGHTMTDEELAIEAAENGYVPYNGDDF